MPLASLRFIELNISSVLTLDQHFLGLIPEDTAGDINMCLDGVEDKVEKSAYCIPPLEIQMAC